MSTAKRSASLLIVPMTLLALAACGDDDAAAPTAATPTTAPRTTASTTTTTEKPTTTEYRATTLRCIDVREQGSYEYRGVCVDGEWVDRRTERPATTTSTMVPPSAAATMQWVISHSSEKDTACWVGMGLTQTVNPSVNFDQAAFDAICAGPTRLRISARRAMRRTIRPAAW